MDKSLGIRVVRILLFRHLVRVREALLNHILSISRPRLLFWGVKILWLFLQAVEFRFELTEVEIVLPGHVHLSLSYLLRQSVHENVSLLESSN